ncbi:MAG: transcription antitermination factor NusB [Candidatus Epulonipiscioides saccharophilum]|nr:MAG: transcription antitermination factor NusB [Epulopiscium sp. AS2M-Bin001]
MTRREARICIIQMLYNLSFYDKGQAEEIFNENTLNMKGKVKLFCKDTFFGILAHMDEIDQIIDQNLISWNIERIPRVDLMILRLAVYEIKFIEGLPSKIIINEAIEIADEYSTEKSGKFVNGILGAISRKYTSKLTPKGSDISTSKLTSKESDIATSNLTSKESDVSISKLTSKESDVSISNLTSKESDISISNLTSKESDISISNLTPNKSDILTSKVTPNESNISVSKLTSNESDISVYG